jgi:hypothetical protein
MPSMPSTLLDPSPPLAVGVLAISILLVWGMRSAAPAERGVVARIVATHVGVTTVVLAMLSILVGRSVGGAANPFIGRVIQIVVSVAMIGLLSVIASKKVLDLEGVASTNEAPSPSPAPRASGGRPA